MNNNPPDLSDKTILTILGTTRNFPEIKETIIFGSRALGNAKHGSDIDLCLKGEKITFQMISKINMILNEETTLPYIIDIVHYESITNQELKDHINRFGIRLQLNS